MSKLVEKVEEPVIVTIQELLKHQSLSGSIKKVVADIMNTRYGSNLEPGKRYKAHPLDSLCNGIILPDKDSWPIRKVKFDFSNFVNEFIAIGEKKSKLPRAQRAVIHELMYQAFSYVYEIIKRERAILRDEKNKEDQPKEKVTRKRKEKKDEEPSF